jgi:hypothetical protein
MREIGSPDVLTVPFAGTLMVPLKLGSEKFDAPQPAGGEVTVVDKLCTVIGTLRLLCTVSTAQSVTPGLRRTVEPEQAGEA